MSEELPSEDEIRAVVRIGLSSLDRDPPPFVVDPIMRMYFEKWARAARKREADEWLHRHLAAMVTP